MVQNWIVTEEVPKHISPSGEVMAEIEAADRSGFTAKIPTHFGELAME